MEESASKIKQATQGVTEMTAKFTESSTMYRDALVRSPPQSNGTEPRYSQLGPRLRAREGMRARQVLIDLDRAEEASALRDNNVSEIRDKANKALAASCAPQDTLEHQVKAVTKLRNRGILLELNSNTAVVWFLDSETRKSFLSHFHPSATIKPRLYNVVVQFVPLSFRPGREADLQEIEEVNGVEVGGISKAR